MGNDIEKDTKFTGFFCLFFRLLYKGKAEMLLYPKLAENIVNEVQSVMDEDIIVVDESGVIIASTQKERIGHIHAGARKVFQTKPEAVH